MDPPLDFSDGSAFHPGVEEPILLVELVGCEGLPRSRWATKAVTVVDSMFNPMAKGVCHCVDSALVVGGVGPLGNCNVAIQIIASLNNEVVPSVWAWSLGAWSIDFVFYNSFSLQDHERQDTYNVQLAKSRRPRRTAQRVYITPARNPGVVKVSLIDGKLFPESINLVASKTCCTENCVQHFPRNAIKDLRIQMYQCTDWKFKNFMKLEVHRQLHKNASCREVVTLEGIDVCQQAWMHIMGVLKSTFYNKRNEVVQGVRESHHGNLGLKKPRKHVLQATTTLRVLLDRMSDHMPHKSHTLPNGEKVVSMSLPASFKWKVVIPQLNDVNNQFGLPPILQSRLNKIKKLSFSEYSCKSPGDAFARCSTCDRYKSLVSMTNPGSKPQDLWLKKLESHLGAQRAHHELYYANKYFSITNPSEVLTFIHDKMDHAKTALPLFSHKTKMNDAWMKLPIAITGMIAHGDGDVRYAHYGLNLYPSDCNHTVGSIVKLLRDLGREPKSSSRKLFEHSGSAPLFEALLGGKDLCKASLPPTPEIRLVQNHYLPF